MIKILIILTSLVLYLLVGFTIAFLVFKNEETCSEEQEEELDKWFAIASVAWPLTLIVCCVYTAREIIKDIKKKC